METLSKLYLELANVVPHDCQSARELELEKSLQKHIDAYGIALMMIREGCAEPQEVARKAIEKFAD